MTDDNALDDAETDCETLDFDGGAIKIRQDIPAPFSITVSPKESYYSFTTGNGFVVDVGEDWATIATDKAPTNGKH